MSFFDNACVIGRKLVRGCLFNILEQIDRILVKMFLIFFKS